MAYFGVSSVPYSMYIAFSSGVEMVCPHLLCALLVMLLRVSPVSDGVAALIFSASDAASGAMISAALPLASDLMTLPKFFLYDTDTALWFWGFENF